MLKVLHVCNTAGVASVIAKFMDKFYGTQSHVIHRRGVMRRRACDEIVDCGPWRFALKCLLKTRKYELVHVHDFDKLLSWITVIYEKPIIMHYHGSRVRGKWKERTKYYRHASTILYSTPDLKERETPERAIYLPNPVDTDMFYPVCNRLKKPNSALTFSHDADDLAEALADQYNLELMILQRNVPHIDMPKTLSQFEYYIEVKRDREGRVLGKQNCVSVTALQALSCGLKVVKRDGKIMEGLPKQHEPENVCRQLYEIYDSILEEGSS